MRIITSIAEMRSFSLGLRQEGKLLGLVPTMGALHDGHLGLVRRAKGRCDAVAVSIFVNPTQFGPGEDLSRYPRDLDKDVALLRPFDLEAVFVPSAAEMYPPGFNTFVDPGYAAQPLEGAARTSHFRGVATVVLKLFDIVRPDMAYFGQKDFQQALVVRRLVEDLNLDVRLVICPIEREPSGLARSSRNAYLGAEDRQAATVLYRSLKRAEQLVHAGEASALLITDEMKRVFAGEPRVQLEYAAIVEPAGLQPVEQVQTGCVALVAARFGAARLIDNLILGPPGLSQEQLAELAFRAHSLATSGTTISGLETDLLKRRIESCRDCAAISSIVLPPREFLSKYVKRDYPDLGAVRVAVIGRDAPFNPEHFLYRSPASSDRFIAGLYELVGVKDFAEFKQRFALTDAIRCHSGAMPVSPKALELCAKHLRRELELFPNLEALVTLGEDAYQQIQRLRSGQPDGSAVVAFADRLRERDWASEEIRLPWLGERPIRVFYCHHPTAGYKRSPSLASLLRSR